VTGAEDRRLPENVKQYFFYHASKRDSLWGASKMGSWGKIHEPACNYPRLKGLWRILLIESQNSERETA
jgi:hypothetical protein